MINEDIKNIEITDMCPICVKTEFRTAFNPLQLFAPDSKECCSCKRRVCNDCLNNEPMFNKENNLVGYFCKECEHKAKKNLQIPFLADINGVHEIMDDKIPKILDYFIEQLMKQKDIVKKDIEDIAENISKEYFPKILEDTNKTITNKFDEMKVVVDEQLDKRKDDIIEIINLTIKKELTPYIDKNFKESSYWFETLIKKSILKSAVILGTILILNSMLIAFWVFIAIKFIK